MKAGGGFTSARIGVGVRIQKRANLIVEGSNNLVVYICEPRADAPREGRLDDADVVRVRDEAGAEGVVHCQGLQQYISKILIIFGSIFWGRFIRTAPNPCSAERSSSRALRRSLINSGEQRTTTHLSR